MHRFKNKIYFNEQEMMAELPPSMSNQVAEHMYGSTMRNCPLFRGLGTPVINKICRLVVPTTYMKGQVSLSAYQPCNGLVFMTQCLREYALMLLNGVEGHIRTRPDRHGNVLRDKGRGGSDPR